MIKVKFDCNEPATFGDHITETVTPHGYQPKCIIEIELHESQLSGEYGEGYEFMRTKLKLTPAYWWNGSNVVPDRPWCLMASAFHDAACEAINKMLDSGRISRFRAWWLRRWADFKYGRICDIQGAVKARAGIRILGLRLRSLIPFKTF